MNQYVNDFNKLLLRFVYGFEELEDQISTLNKLFTDCLESHAPYTSSEVNSPYRSLDERYYYR